MALWVGAQGQVTSAKTTQKHPHLLRHPQTTQNWKKFFSIEARRLAESVDGLNTSVVLSHGELRLKQSLAIYRLLRSSKGFNSHFPRGR